MSFLDLATILLFLIGVPVVTVIFVRNCFQKGAIEGGDFKQWFSKVWDLFWGMG